MPAARDVANDLRSANSAHSPRDLAGRTLKDYKDEGMDVNPYSSPATQMPINRPSHAALVFFTLAAFGFYATPAAAGIFIWAAYYRLDDTDAFGRRLTPPPIPLNVADGIFFLR